MAGCLMPLFDLANDAGIGGGRGRNAGLELRDEGLCIVAGGAPLLRGDELLFEYQPGAPLRDLLRSYCFVPQPRPSLPLPLSDGGAADDDGRADAEADRRRARGLNEVFHLSLDDDDEKGGASPEDATVHVLRIFADDDDEDDDDDDDDERGAALAGGDGSAGRSPPPRRLLRVVSFTLGAATTVPPAGSESSLLRGVATWTIARGDGYRGAAAAAAGGAAPPPLEWHCAPAAPPGSWGARARSREVGGGALAAAAAAARDGDGEGTLSARAAELCDRALTSRERAEAAAGGCNADTVDNEMIERETARAYRGASSALLRRARDDLRVLAALFALPAA